MAVVNKVNFTVANKEYAIVRPTSKILQDAQREYNKSFSAGIKDGLLTNLQLQNYLRKANVWDDEKEAERNSLIKAIAENTKIVKGLTKDCTLSKAKEAAIQIRRDRIKLVNLTSELNEMQSNTVEGQAENHRFTFLLVNCLVDANTKKPIFKNVDEFLSSEDVELTSTANTKFANFYYGYNEEKEKELPENEFLLKYKFCNEDLRLVKIVDGKEHLVDAKGRLINEEGRYINEAGEFVDSEGNRVDADGNPIAEVFAFLPD